MWCLRYASLLVPLLVTSFAAEDFYKLLNISKDATTRELRKAFKKAALETHPDKNKDNPDAHDRFVLINRAYETLKDPDLRKRYDLFGEEGAGGQTRPKYQSWNYYHDNFGIYDDDPEIVTLDRAEFEQVVRQTPDTWFINFYSPGCGHCHDLAPVWRRVARELENVVRIGAVNCADEWQLCREERVFSYPELVLYPQTESYEGQRTASRLVRHALQRLHTAPIDVDSENVQHLSQRAGALASRPWLLFFCREDNCASEDTRVKLAAMMEGVLNVGQVDCSETSLCTTLGHDEYAVYYEAGQVSVDKGRLVRWLDAQEIAAEVLPLLPRLPTVSETEYNARRRELERSSEPGTLPWLVQFTSDLTATVDLVRLPSLLASTSFSRLDCAALPHVCADLHIRRPPAFVLFKRAGGYETLHGRATAADVAAFSRAAASAPLRVLTPADFPSVLSDGRPRLVDFYAPWCPPCMRLLPELRKASSRRPDLPFGSVDCTAHSELCSRYNIRSYPTVILYNSLEEHHYRGPHTAEGLLEFVTDILSPAVLLLEDEVALGRARRRPPGQLWLIDFYADWCQPCERFAPKFRRAAGLLQPLEDVVVAMVNCDSQRAFCQEQRVTSYPTVRLYGPTSSGLNQHSEFSGDRTDHVLLAWTAGHLPDLVHELTGDQLMSRVLDGDGSWLVDFYSPHCGHCVTFAPLFQMVAKVLQDEVRCGRLDCRQYGRTCRDVGVSAYPTVKLYRGGGHLDMVGANIDSQEPGTIVTLVRQRLPELLREPSFGRRRDEL